MSDQTMEAFLERDLWWEARQQTAALEQDPWIKILSAVIRTLAPSKAPKFGDLNTLMMVDLNKYRPDVNVELLIDQGVQLFGLRVGGPGRWEFGNWAYAVDSTFTMYHDRIRAYAKATNKLVWIVGYGVHNPWANEDNNYNGIDPQVTWLREATQNHKCDQYAWDDEVAECWKNGGNTICTPTNLRKSISICMEQTLTQFERNTDGSYKIPVHYSANWYMKKYAPAEYQAWLDQAAVDPANRRFLTWRAWLPVVYTATFAQIRDLFNEFITPTGLQENAYLKMGSEPAADLWQATFTAKGPWTGPNSSGGIDASTGYNLSRNVADYARNANLPTAVTPPVDTEPPSAVGSFTGNYEAGVIALTWTPATDNVGVTSYLINRNGVAATELPGTATSYSDPAVLPGTGYAYTIRAKDAAGNIGPAASTFITTPGTPPDTGDLTEVIQRLEVLQADMNQVKADVAVIREHFRP